MFGAKPTRGGNFLGHRLLVDIFIVVAVRLEPKQPVLPYLHDAFRRRVQADDQRPLQPFDTGGNGTPGTSGTFAVFTPRLAR